MNVESSDTGALRHRKKEEKTAAEAFFMIHKSWKQPRCSLGDKWVKMNPVPPTVT